MDVLIQEIKDNNITLYGKWVIKSILIETFLSSEIPMSTEKTSDPNCEARLGNQPVPHPISRILFPTISPKESSFSKRILHIFYPFFIQNRKKTLPVITKLKPFSTINFLTPYEVFNNILNF